MGRSIVAIVIGFVLIGALAVGADAAFHVLRPGYFTADGGTTTPVALLIMLAYVFVFATLGCYITGRLAPNRPLRHAMILGVLGLVFNVVGTIRLWHTAPAWYHVAALLMVLPAAYLGGFIAERRSPLTAQSATR